jgi:hypothetical protein
MRGLLMFGTVTAMAIFVAPLPASASDPAPEKWVNNLEPISAADWNYSRAAHLLERAGFGGAPAEIEKLAAMKPAEAVNYLVEYQKVDATSLPPFERSGIYPHGHKLIPLQQIVPKASATGMAYGIKATQKGALPYQPAIDEFYTLLFSEYMEMQRASDWWAERMLLTPRPLEEKLALFWHNHFATSQAKVLNFELMLRQNDTLRKHANGNFHDMLVAIAQDPAMLIWLDNKENVKGKPNENFAREVMELFTMGEGRGYTEHDIREIARALTGWTLRPIETVKDKADFVDDPKLHDDGEKTFLGRTGKFNGYDAINIILEQPAVSKFIAGKLYRYFVRDTVDERVNEELAKQLKDSKFELKPLLKTLFLSKDFYSQPSEGTQIKSPVHFLVSTSRKLGLQQIPGIPDFVETSGPQLGQMLFQPPNVAGWPGGKSWINPATLLTRGNYVYNVLFPDPAHFIPPDKQGPEGYRKIPLKFQQYNIVPHVWNAKTARMEPVSLAEYDRYLAGISTGMMSNDKAMNNDKMMAAKPNQPPEIRKMDANLPKSKMTQLATGERYNLAVGVYKGYVEAYNRVKPIPRQTANVNFVAMADEGQAQTAEQAVDYFVRRFLSVPLQPERRAAVVDFLQGELGNGKIDFSSQATERALRRAVHLILSAPEYQLG